MSTLTTSTSPANKGLITGLITALGAVIFAFFQQNGLPATTVGWEILGIIVFLNSVAYFLKNLIAPSVSLLGTVDLRDVLSGLVLAVCNAVSVWAASAITQTTLNWPLLWSTAVGVSLSYIGSKFGFGKKIVKTADDSGTGSITGSGDTPPVNPDKPL